MPSGCYCPSDTVGCCPSGPQPQTCSAGQCTFQQRRHQKKQVSQKNKEFQYRLGVPFAPPFQMVSSELRKGRERHSGNVYFFFIGRSAEGEMALNEEAHNGLLCFQNSGFTKEKKGQPKHGLSQAPRQIFLIVKYMEKSKQEEESCFYSSSYAPFKHHSKAISFMNFFSLPNYN